MARVAVVAVAPAAPPATLEAASQGPYARAWSRLRRDPAGLLALGIAAAVLACIAIVPALVPIDPYQQNLRNSLLPPGSAGHVLGTDAVGRDLLLRLIDGGRTTLSVAAAAVIVSAVFGCLAGLVAGYLGGVVDRVLMRLVDVELAFPGIILALLLVTVLGPGVEKVMIAVGIGGIPRFARVIRGAALQTKQEVYVEAARSIGATPTRIMLAHVLPQAFGPVLTITTFGLANAILAIAALSFLGLGAQAPTAEWGLMLSESRRFMQVAWWVPVSIGAAISGVALVGNLLGEALRDALDPRL